jgi:hypothetical protein
MVKTSVKENNRIHQRLPTVENTKRFLARHIINNFKLPAFGRLRQEDPELEASLTYTVSSRLAQTT